MSKKQKRIRLTVFFLLVAVLLAGIFLLDGGHEGESVKAVMRDAVLHEEHRVSFFGILEVNPAVISAYVVTGVLLLFALCVRLFAVPRFQNRPDKLQSILELAVEWTGDMAKSNSPHHYRFLSVYLFVAAIYIAVGTAFELFGFQVVTTAGHSVPLPAPLADINGAIGMGFLSYSIILLGGIMANGFRGVGLTLKEFSLPISMSFRLFGALLSGLLVTELVYHYTALSFVLPVVVGVMFTLLHAIIQTYVLTTLTSIFYGEVTEPLHSK